ncbi:MAG: lysylphosphatidylglycerol synthase transmembrane domain-containing protein [Bacteroidota bacterium]
MEQSKANKGNPYWYGGIKLLIAAIAFIFIYRQVFSKENFSDILLEYRQLFLNSGNGTSFVIVVLLMLVNWSLEALKWKLMMRRLESVPFTRALAAVFSGLTVSFFTPNRIGEYAGRIFHLRSANRIKGTLVTILENLSQLIITVVIGSVSLVFYLQRYSGLHEYILWVIGVLMVFFSAAILFLFLEVPVLEQSILKMKRLKKLSPYFEVLSEYKKDELLVLICLALLRYMVFTFQFLMLLKIFDVNGPLLLMILLINMIFFVLTLVPTFALAEIGVRGAVATYFLSRVSPDSLAILNASVSLWLINLVTPALIGIAFIFQFRFNKDKG